MMFVLNRKREVFFGSIKCRKDGEGEGDGGVFELEERDKMLLDGYARATNVKGKP